MDSLGAPEENVESVSSLTSLGFFSVANLLESICFGRLRRATASTEYLLCDRYPWVALCPLSHVIITAALNAPVLQTTKVWLRRIRNLVLMQVADPGFWFHSKTVQ